MQTAIDHLVIGADNLEQGIAYVKDCLGVDIPYGGAHIKMGTHNHLMQLGNQTFLEVIAINPDIEAPASPRWYGLDDPFIRRQIKSQPTLLTWVVNTRNIGAFMQQSSFSFGKAELISRGDLSWYFGLPRDGRLLAGGMLPYVIEWQSDTHPSNHMIDSGCRLQRLEIHHPDPGWIQSILQAIGAIDLIHIHSLSKNKVPQLKAYIETPNGIKKMSSPQVE